MDELGTVLDPFAGAGTVASVCEDLERHSVSVELNPDYGEMIRKRLDARVRQGKLFEAADGRPGD